MKLLPGNNSNCIKDDYECTTTKEKLPLTTPSFKVDLVVRFESEQNCQIETAGITSLGFQCFLSLAKSVTDAFLYASHKEVWEAYPMRHATSSVQFDVNFPAWDSKVGKLDGD